jgi:hypothetical protein
MSNRNFDSRVIIQRLQDQVNANNLYKYQQAGQRIISNPQVSNPTSQRIYSYKEGIETTYYTSVYGTVCSSPSGILNLVATGPVIEPITPPEPYIYKYWALSLAGANVFSNDITTDINNNIYVIGQYDTNPLQISSFSTVSSGIILMSSFGILTSFGGTDAFIVKYNSSGIAQWATNIGGTGTNNDNGLGITTDRNNNVYVTGLYNSNIVRISSFSSISSGIIILSSFGTLGKVGSDDAFIVKYNSSGIVQWATNLSGNGAERGYKIDSDINNNVYVTGFYNSNPLIISNFSTVSTGIIRLSSFGTLSSFGGISEAFVLKYNSSGIAQWATNIGGSGSEVGYGITTDMNNNVYVTGAFTTSPLRISSFSTVSSGIIRLSSFGSMTTSNTDNTFIVKYNSSGIAQWATNLEGTPTIFSYGGIITDKNNNVYVTGFYNSNPLRISSFSTVTSGIIRLSTFGTLVNNIGGSTDAYLVKYNSSGIVQFATSLGGINEDVGNAITTDLNNNVYVTGYYKSSTLRISSFSTVSSNIVLMSSFGTLSNISTNFNEVFIVKYNSSGIVEAATRLGGSNDEMGRGITTDQNNDVYITGIYRSNPLEISGFSTVSSGVVVLSSFGTLSNSGSTNTFVVKMNSSLQMY